MSTDSVDVLLVDDNPYDVELALRAFKNERPGTRVAVARDGAEALELLMGKELAEPLNPRLVLLDLYIAKIDGLEVLNRLRQFPRTRHLTVVVMTSSRQDADVERAYSAGANSYIVKPLEYSRFMDVMRETIVYWLNRRAPTSAR